MKRNTKQTLQFRGDRNGYKNLCAINNWLIDKGLTPLGLVSVDGFDGYARAEAIQGEYYSYTHGCRLREFLNFLGWDDAKHTTFAEDTVESASRAEPTYVLNREAVLALAEALSNR